MTVTEVIELAKALAWPFVTGCGLWYFKDPIVALLPRVTKVGPVALEPPAPQVSTAVLAAETATNEGMKRLEGVVGPELLVEAKALVTKSVPAGVKGNREAELDYLTALAGAVIMIALFENAYGSIWGSQLRFLHALNSAPLSEEKAKEFYENAVQQYGSVYAEYSFESWITFLVKSLLMLKNDDGHFQITLRGRAFLRFIVDAGYFQEKAF